MKNPFDEIKDETYKKRLKIQLGILTAVFGVFFIMMIAYLVTLHKYSSQDKAGAPESKQTQSEITVNAAEEEPEKPITEPAAAKEPETPDPGKTEETISSVSDNMPPDDFMKKTDAVYEAEKETVLNICRSDTLYLSYTTYGVNETAYTLTHVIIKDPSQLSLIYSKNRRHAVSVYESIPYVFAITGSNMTADLDNVIPGLHIRNHELQSDNGTAVGNELVFLDDGTLLKADTGTTWDKLKNMGASWSVTTEKPLLIRDEILSTIPLDYAGTINCKSAVGMVEPGEYYFLAASGGNYISTISYYDMQTVLQEKGCVFAQAISTDINVIMAVNGKVINNPAEKEGRPQFEYIIVTE